MAASSFGEKSGSYGSLDVAIEVVVLGAQSGTDTTTTLPDSIESIANGQTYYLEVWVSDVGDINTGIISAYVDLSFPDAAASVTSISHGSTFTVFMSDSAGTGTIDELGGSTVDEGIGVEPEWARVAIVEMYADAAAPPRVEFELSSSSTGVSAYGRGGIGWEDIWLGDISVPYCSYADVSGDECKVDYIDFGICALAWLTEDGEEGWNSNCDVSYPADGVINIQDLVVIAGDWLSGAQ
jgi:hypothetical protein